MEFGERFIGRGGQVAGRRAALGHGPAQGGAALRDVVGFAAIVRGTVERRTHDLFIGERDVEAVAELHQLALVELFLLMGDVAALAGLAEPVALDRAGQNHGRRTLVRDRGGVGGVDLDRVVAAQPQPPKLVVAEVFNKSAQARVDAPEILTDVRAAGHGVLLVLPVDNFAHPPDQQPVLVAREQRVPLAAPDHLDHVPAHAAEDGLELLDDLSVAAHGAVEPLEVAVDHEDQVVERLA